MKKNKTPLKHSYKDKMNYMVPQIILQHPGHI